MERRYTILHFITNSGVIAVADLTKALDGITADDYAAMRKNIMRVSNSFIEGHYLKRALKEACETLDK